LLEFTVPNGTVTDAGLRNNVSVGIQYLESWLRGVGAAAIFNLMEDAATSEIARSQVWQWAQHGAQLAEGATVDAQLVRRIEDEELQKIRDAVGEETYAKGKLPQAKQLFERVALEVPFIEFLTIPAYEALP
jgi:malate synthase